MRSWTAGPAVGGSAPVVTGASIVSPGAVTAPRRETCWGQLYRATKLASIRPGSVTTAGARRATSASRSAGG